jgi:hypothetical protein
MEWVVKEVVVVHTVEQSKHIANTVNTARTQEGNKDKPYTHPLSLNSPAIYKLFTPTGSKVLLSAQGKGSQRGIELAKATKRA